ncbi:hypothetical protein F2P81_019254 [Scophthalmus maximus]|uniref:Uncharacterized protein n=1 Tax=Scophthalmus maximus TaxID=52904 RepID=A0A6A4S525_SCOMX|nr:hypothetical protein F2P81_019254 [Scophthalmus maximus]
MELWLQMEWFTIKAPMSEQYPASQSRRHRSITDDASKYLYPTRQAERRRPFCTKDTHFHSAGPISSTIAPTKVISVQTAEPEMM